MEEAVRQRARERTKETAYLEHQPNRRKIEALFGELKNRIGLRRVRLRRLKYIREQFLMAAAAQNLKRLVRYLASGPTGSNSSNNQNSKMQCRPCPKHFRDRTAAARGRQFFNSYIHRGHIWSYPFKTPPSSRRPENHAYESSTSSDRGSITSDRTKD
jgi:hypothetical protein